MLRCSKCKRFIKGNTVTYLFNKFTEEIKDVRGVCSKCGEVEVEWDCYEDIVGYEGVDSINEL
ncbi:MAG: hypothetical protein ACFFCI_17880 [Promethearchaeota archaeon]